MAPITSSIAFPSGSAQLNGYLAQPDGNGPFPALVLIHEAYGLNENMRDIASRFAEQGYVALAVDLFTGRNRMICMARVFYGMIFNSAEHFGIDDLKSALTYLTAQSGVDSQHLGAVGYCMGGSLAVAWACTDKRLRVIAPYYGVNPRPDDMLTRLCPVVGSYPGNDFTTKAGQKLEIVLERENIPHDIKSYPGAGHSFFNDTSRNYNADAAADSWHRVLAFFKEHIG